MATRFLHLRLVGPAVAAITLLIAGFATIPYYAVSRLDDEARYREQILVEKNIDLWIKDVEFSLTAWTIWDESIAKLDNTFDNEWTDRNIGRSLIGTSRTRFAAVLDGRDTKIYALTDEETSKRPFFHRGEDVVISDAHGLVEKVRKDEQSVVTAGIPQPVTQSRIEVLGDEAVLLTASLFQPDFRTAIPRGKRAPILITAMPLEGSLPSFFGDRFLLDDPRVGPLSSADPSRVHAAIAVNPTGEVEVLSWQPRTAAADLFAKAFPLIVLVTVLLALAGTFAIILARKTIGKLVDNEHRLQHAATHDFLTGLSNRSLLHKKFEELLKQRTLSVACLDLDGFKAVNDNHGHAVGDHLLKIVAQRLKAALRDDDLTFRLGGDEFAILMPGLTTSQAEDICHGLRASLSAPMDLNGIDACVGASFGLSQATAGLSFGETMRAADDALYQAKARGRGRVVVSENCRATTPKVIIRSSG